jgi:hypothetical protein
MISASAASWKVHTDPIYPRSFDDVGDAQTRPKAARTADDDAGRSITVTEAPSGLFLRQSRNESIRRAGERAVIVHREIKIIALAGDDDLLSGLRIIAWRRDRPHPRECLAAGLELDFNDAAVVLVGAALHRLSPCGSEARSAYHGGEKRPIANRLHFRRSRPFVPEGTDFRRYDENSMYVRNPSFKASSTIICYFRELSA